MSNSRFTKNNEGFSCEHCGKPVPGAQKTCRNHCPFCLHSKHVDIFPGDRANSCQGLMRPTGYETDGKKGLVIHFVCTRCGEKTRNIALREGQEVADDYDKILALSGKS